MKHLSNGKLKFLIFCILCLITTFSLFPITITVKQNGSGDFSTIQSAIVASVNNDTVLVYPGTYFENVDFLGKNITLASLVLTTGNILYRDSTIINGNQSGSCIRANILNNSGEINGFTLTNGSGTPFVEEYYTEKLGGGILINYVTSFRISNCIISNNNADVGGGVFTSEGLVYFSNNIICNNNAVSGGGIFTISNTIFDPINRCSVYNNYAGNSNDIFFNYTGYDVDLYLDIATVLNPVPYYIKSSKILPNFPGDIETLAINQAFRTEINHDFFVSPNGDDQNDGLTVQTPLKTLVKALHSIQSDSLNPKTIYVASGTYSTDDGQLYPLGLKSYVSVVGDSIQVPILENKRFNINLVATDTDNVLFKNFTYIFGENHPYGNISIYNCNNIKLINVKLNDLTSPRNAAVFFYKSQFEIDGLELININGIEFSGLHIENCNGKISNLKIDNCRVTGFDDYSNVVIAKVDSVLIMENVSITNCFNPNPYSTIFHIYSNNDNSLKLVFKNVLISNNQSINSYIPIIISNSDNNLLTEITNCTFSHNTPSGAGMLYFGLALNGKFKICNSIFDNNSMSQIAIGNQTMVDFSNNFIKGYPQSVAANIPTNINYITPQLSGDPGFVGTNWDDPYNYRLHHTSQLINAGTADTTGLSLPEFDLLGNPRIYQDIVDIGAYEWDGTVGTENQNLLFTDHSLSNYPNPFNPETSISFNLEKASFVSIDIFNVKGQKIKTLTSSKFSVGQHTIVWDGKDDHQSSVSSGIYIYQLKSDNFSATRKMILLK